jgi:hypothetical protein
MHTTLRRALAAALAVQTFWIAVPPAFAQAIAPTPLATVEFEPGHTVEFVQLPSGVTALHETMHEGQTPVAQTVVAQTGSPTISLASVYSSVTAQDAPTALVEADATYASLAPAAVTGAVASVTPTSIVLQQPPPVDSQFLNFEANVCDRYIVDGAGWCGEGTGIVVMPDITQSVQYWGVWGYVPSSDWAGELFWGTQYDYSTGAWITVWNSTVEPGDTDWWGVNPNPAWLNTSGIYPFESTFTAQLGWGNDDVELDMAANYNICGNGGELPCPGNMCANGGLTPSDGFCEPCGAQGQPACTQMTACNSGLTPVGGICVPIATKTFKCPASEVNAGNLGYGSLSLGVANTGDWGLIGQTYDIGAGVDNYFLGIALYATNSSGQRYAQGQTGTVTGWGVPNGNRTSYINQSGNDPSIPGNWAAISDSGFTCYADDSPQILPDLASAFYDAGVAAVAILVAVAGAGDHCRWGNDAYGNLVFQCTP